MGQAEEALGTDVIKFPRGFLNHGISGHDQSDILWKLTGNLGGEQYRDLVRGPLNEACMCAERQGYHYPSPPTSEWTRSNPVENSLPQAGVELNTASFRLDVPDGWDVPMSGIVGNFTKSTPGENYRRQLSVNVNNLGPQTVFPVSNGILNHDGTT
ncbi:uncharacterized protein N7498_008069 [Penicillium cinerascens]|uniref:Beta-galactosidase jelly roll domain-containing protein n=1 Tax=Penicillium cinerascens TaxID=70096 RepID=A0A9W9JEN7_9EURO|nr:uncharacterized protein N7498_008069 [Penicillium cinerascens]KAJ5194631.1 hypothetical protein N7498_008069 [Penicillium cinerascens]